VGYKALLCFPFSESSGLAQINYSSTTSLSYLMVALMPKEAIHPISSPATLTLSCTSLHSHVAEQGTKQSTG